MDKGMISNMLLETLKNELEKYKEKLIEEANKRREYQGKVDALNSLYERMKTKKDEMENLKNSLKSFVDKSYDYWQGDVFNNRYETNVRQELLENDYGKMLTIIDDNLDSINNIKMNYQNLIYQSNGIIGDVQICINTIKTQVQNWTN